MADESEIEATLVDLIDADLYPNGRAGPPVVDYDMRIFPGWPVSASLEQDLADEIVCVSVYAVPGTTSDVGQPFIDVAALQIPPALGLTATASDHVITITGAPTDGEYVTAIIAQKGYSYLSAANDTAGDVASGLAALIAVDHPGVSVTGGTITLPADGPDVIVRSGAPATIGERIHRQRQQFRVVIWAATPEARSAVAKRVDLCLKRNLKITMPDQTQVLVNAVGSNPSDLYQLDGVYRRDLMLAITYDTLDTYTAYPITHAQIEDSPDIIR